ncbi:MAG TPA: hypothetical protein VKP30_07165 [Polyangiaceae bacterium]|nr:hypothetical protein [Polyangiaceae bacterium]
MLGSPPKCGRHRIAPVPDSSLSDAILGAIIKALMEPLSQIMWSELAMQVPKVPFPKDDEVIQTLGVRVDRAT